MWGGYSRRMWCAGCVWGTHGVWQPTTTQDRITGGRPPRCHDCNASTGDVPVEVLFRLHMSDPKSRAALTTGNTHLYYLADARNGDVSHRDAVEDRPEFDGL